MSTLKTKVILNTKTAAEWILSDVVLLSGELGIESDTNLIKIGDGKSTWNNLSYTSISDIADIEGIEITNPTNGQILTYNNGEWNQKPASRRSRNHCRPWLSGLCCAIT